MTNLARRALYIAWLIALVASATSLFWSMILGWLPCDLCWYERICMYPLALILGVGVFTRGAPTLRTALPFTVVGALLSVYHYLIQILPSFAKTATCSAAVPCQVADFAWFGWITPPLLAFAGFVVIFTLLLMHRRSA